MMKYIRADRGDNIAVLAIAAWLIALEPPIPQSEKIMAFLLFECSGK
jgi:hypothetical protein